jgi:NAD(P)-dependent dehydrogenase (short-subunit alcohol dehydrogenase family)
MKVAGSTALVTGANRGLGLAFAKVLVEMDAAKVYAAARVAGYINLLINNAGIARPGGFLADGAVEPAREQFEVNFVGPLRMARAFAPVLAKNGGGAIINVLSVASWMNGPTLATYGASKSAAWALTNGLRLELARQGTRWSCCMQPSSTPTLHAISTRRRVRPRKSYGQRSTPSNAGKVRSWPMRLRARCIAVYRRIPRPISRPPPRFGRAWVCRLAEGLREPAGHSLFGFLGESIVVLRNPQHRRLRIGPHHDLGERAHLLRSLAPMVRVVDEAMTHDSHIAIEN